MKNLFINVKITGLRAKISESRVGCEMRGDAEGKGADRESVEGRGRGGGDGVRKGIARMIKGRSEIMPIFNSIKVTDDIKRNGNIDVSL